MRSKLNADQIQMIIHALRIAAEKFKETAIRCEGMGVSELFEKHYRDSTDPANELKNVASIILIN